jgi:hypothetical protein
VLSKFVQHMKAVPGVQFSTARDLHGIYRNPLPSHADRKLVADHLTKTITFLSTGDETLSPADMLIQLVGLEQRFVDGPTARGTTTLTKTSIPREAFNACVRDAADFIQRNRRLPNEVFIGAETLSLPDFAATLARSFLTDGPEIPVTRGNVQFEKYFAKDATRSFSWPIHPDGFSAPELLELGRLQGWTLKPAQFR